MGEQRTPRSRGSGNAIGILVGRVFYFTGMQITAVGDPASLNWVIVWLGLVTGLRYTGSNLRTAPASSPKGRKSALKACERPKKP